MQPTGNAFYALPYFLWLRVHCAKDCETVGEDAFCWPYVDSPTNKVTAPWPISGKLLQADSSMHAWLGHACVICVQANASMHA